MSSLSDDLAAEIVRRYGPDQVRSSSPILDPRLSCHRLSSVPDAGERVGL